MFHLANNTALRGIGYKALNVLRAANIVTLLAIAAASWVMVVKAGMDGHFYFFDAISHVFVSSIALFLVATELQFGFLATYIARAWPVFSAAAGLLWLGLAMVVLGCDMLANLNKAAFTADAIGLPLWRLILASGVLGITFGVANLVATAVFRDGPARLTARMIRADGNLAAAQTATMQDYYLPPTAASLKRYNSAKETEVYPAHLDGSGVGHGAGGLAGAAGAAGRRLKRMTQAFKSPFPFGDSAAKKMQISAPIAVDHYDEPAGHGDRYAHTADADLERADNHSAYASTYPEDRASPILPAVRRPPTALHPALNNHYSVADIDRF